MLMFCVSPPTESVVFLCKRKGFCHFDVFQTLNLTKSYVLLQTLQCEVIHLEGLWWAGEKFLEYPYNPITSKQIW